MHRRFFILSGLTVAVAGCATGTARLAPGTRLYIIRHMDRADNELTTLGRARAEALVAALEGAPLDAIYSPGIKRNLDSAAPLAAARGIAIERRPQEDPGPRLARDAAGRSALWMGNKGNLRAIWESLSLPGAPPLDYGDLAIVTVDAVGRVAVENRRVEP